MKKIVLFKPYMSWKARFYALRVLMGDMIGEGPVVKQFEKEFSERFNLQTYGVAVNSGTSALELAYHLAGIGPGTEVITTVLTCTATNIPLLHTGCKIVFSDIDEDLNVSTKDIRQKITPQTRAIVFTHFGGNNRGLDELLQICDENKITLIEDAAQAVGSNFWGRADFTAVSFQAIKTLTSVDGGMLICRREEDRLRARKLRWYGYDRDLKHKTGDTDLMEAGWKKHMSDVTAAIGLGNLRSFNKPYRHRLKLASVYEQYGIKCHAWLAIGMLNQGSAVSVFRMQMAENGVDVGQHHFRNDKYTIFKHSKTSLPKMDELENRYVFFPYHTGVSVKQAHKIGKLFLKYK